VFGGLDGIITTFAIVCAAIGADLGHKTVIIMGLANLMADAISMGKFFWHGWWLIAWRKGPCVGHRPVPS